ncbi:MAG: tetratricopeptide repeat protein [Planctomycetia bacterium]
MAEIDRLLKEAKDFVARKDYERAAAVLNDAIRLAPNNADLYMMRGDVHLELGDFVQSTADFDKSNSLRMG